MKKIVLSLIAISGFAFASKAQNFGFQKGDVILEGSIGTNVIDNKDTKTKSTNFNFSPKAGYFLSDKFAVGIAPGYGESKNANYLGSTDKTNTLSIGLFGRYYFLEAGKRFKVYTELDLTFSQTGGETSNGITTIKYDKTNTIGANAGIGANFFITKKIAVGYQFADVLGYSYSKVDKRYSEPTNSFHINLNNFGNFFNTGQFSLTFKL